MPKSVSNVNASINRLPPELKLVVCNANFGSSSPRTLGTWDHRRNEISRKLDRLIVLSPDSVKAIELILDQYLKDETSPALEIKAATLRAHRPEAARIVNDIVDRLLTDDN